jgi:hypothetical protein
MPNLERALISTLSPIIIVLPNLIFDLNFIFVLLPRKIKPFDSFRKGFKNRPLIS